MKKSTIKRAAALAVAGMMTATALAGCGGSSSSGSSKDDSSAAGNAKNGKVYYLNFKPEQDKDWQALAKKYTEETGVEVTVKTAAEGTYESTLTAEMDEDNAPTLFQVNGPVGLANWKDYCADLSSSEIYNQLTSKDYALEEDGKVYGIAYVIETYGIIYNKTLLQKYCDSDFASVVRCFARYFCMYGAILPLMWYTGERPGSLRYALSLIHISGSTGLPRCGSRLRRFQSS